MPHEYISFCIYNQYFNSKGLSNGGHNALRPNPLNPKLSSKSVFRLQIGSLQFEAGRRDELGLVREDASNQGCSH
jgi:hypothetical protein